MSAEAKAELAPDLRLPEFKQQKPWSIVLGGELFDQVSNKKHNSDLPILAITQEHGAVPRDHIDYHVTVSEKSVASYKVVEPGDFIISLRSFQGGIEFSGFLGLCSPAYVILRLRGEQDPRFFKHLFKTKRFVEELSREIEGVRDGKMVSYKQFSTIRLPLPQENSEMERIADILDSIDALISAETEKLYALKDHRQGLMQQLFPTQRESLPKLRFPEFEDGWRATRLGSIATFSKGKGISKKDINPQGSTYCIRYGELYTTYGAVIDEPVSRTFVDTGELNLSQGGEVIVPSSGEDANDIATAAVVLRSGVAIGGDLNIISSPLFGAFLAYYLSGARKSSIAEMAQGNTVVHLYPSQLETLNLAIPSDPEQRRIASCLETIDKLIDKQGERIEQLVEHKRGLLQRLFPILDEVES